MNPRAVLLWSGSLLAAVVLDSNPVTRLFFLMAGLNVLLVWSKNGIGGALRVVAAGAVFATVISIFFDHAGTHVLARIPASIPIIGGPISLEGTCFGMGTGIGLAAAFVAAMPLATVLDPIDIVNCFPRRLERTAAIVGLGLNMIPRIRRASTAIVEAQTMRGYRRGNLRRVGDVAVPMVMSAVEDSFVMAQAMEARGFGSGRRTQWRTQPWNTMSIAIAITGCAALSAMVIARVMGWTEDWFPFPSWNAPTIEPFAIAAALLFTVPAVLKSHD